MSGAGRRTGTETGLGTGNRNFFQRLRDSFRSFWQRSSTKVGDKFENVMETLQNPYYAAGSELRNAYQDFYAGISGSALDNGSLGGDGASPSHGGSSARTVSFNYPDAPYASAYGMSAATAYQEALAGSAHQREVNDLLRAGLSPVLSASGGGAPTFSGNVYAPSGSSARSNGSAIANIVGGIFSMLTGKSAVGNGAKALIQGLSDLSS